MPDPSRRGAPMPRALGAATLLVAVAGVVCAGCASPAHGRPQALPAATKAVIVNPVAQSSSVPPAPVPLASPSPTSPVAVPVVSSDPVDKLTTRVAPDVFVSSSVAITPSALAAVVKATGATSAELVAVGRVTLGQGQTLAVGVDPSSFRPFTPAGTAESTPLWQAVADGQIAVAHTVAKALAVPLGSTTAVGLPAPAAPASASPASASAVANASAPPATSAVSTTAGASPGPSASAVTQLPPVMTGLPARDFRVGALATTGLPGVGVVVDQRYNASLGLLARSGLVLTASGRDPVVTAALANQTLGASSTATALRVPVSGAGQLTWVAPASGPITAGFGYRDSPIDPGQREFHPGIDIGAPLGSPIYAASGGSVVYAGPASGFGNEVILEHAGNVETVYGHMERILVTAGSPVTVGQPIALVGSEGESTGPHLHFEVHVNGTLTDPLAWLVAHGVHVEQ